MINLIAILESQTPLMGGYSYLQNAQSLRWKKLRGLSQFLDFENVKNHQKF